MYLEELEALFGAGQGEQVRCPRRSRNRVPHRRVHKVPGSEQPLDDARGDVACTQCSRTIRTRQLLAVRSCRAACRTAAAYCFVTIVAPVAPVTQI